MLYFISPYFIAVPTMYIRKDGPECAKNEFSGGHVVGYSSLNSPV